MTKVSVITITRNDLDGLRRTVASVKEQTWDAIEHIVVDANSSDGTPEYLSTLDQSYRWVSEPDDGRYDGMNKGARLATGDVLWFLHSSDIFFEPESVERALSVLDNNPAPWGYGQSIVMTQGRATAVRGEIPFDILDLATGRKIVPHQASFFDADFFWELGGYSIDYGLAADQLFMLRAASRSAPTVVPRILCEFDGAGAGSTRGLLAHLRDANRGRKLAGVRLTRVPLADSVLVALSGFSEVLLRLTRKLARRLAPR